MYPNLIRQIVVVVCIALVNVLAVGHLRAQVKQGKSRALKTAQLMKGVMKPQCTELKKGLDAGPANDESWAGLAVNAAILNELSYVLMDDGRCPDSTWADAASKKLRQGSADVLTAIESKDLAAAKRAFGTMSQSCKACHDAHKKEH